MANFDGIALLAPVACEEIGDETAMAFLWARLGTKKGDTWRPGRRVQTCRDAALFHRREKICFIRGPIFRAAIRLEKFRRWSEQRLVEVFDSGDSFQEEGKVRVLGEAGELAAAVLADVNDLLDAGVREQGEEFLGGFSREPHGAEETLHKI
jgi:hypothetical protein